MLLVAKTNKFYTLEDLINQSIFGRSYVMGMIQDGSIKPFMVSEENSSVALYPEDALNVIHEEEMRNLA